LRAPSCAQHGRTALHAAAEKGHLEVAKMLITAGADLKAHDKARFVWPFRLPLLI
jgi:ankyrin repeat protein